MARYIDADALLENLKKQYGEELGWQCTVNMSDVGMMIEDAAIADVVPKSEVEELNRECESLGKTVNEASELIRKLKGKVEEAKIEVARELFEEMYKKCASKIQPHIRPIFKNDDDFDAGFRNGKTDALIEVLMLIAELKKKYTEEKT